MSYSTTGMVTTLTTMLSYILVETLPYLLVHSRVLKVVAPFFFIPAGKDQRVVGRSSTQSMERIVYGEVLGCI